MNNKGWEGKEYRSHEILYCVVHAAFFCDGHYFDTVQQRLMKNLLVFTLKLGWEQYSIAIYFLFLTLLYRLSYKEN